MLVTLGFVRAAHGVRGTLKCACITDRPETLESYRYVILSDDVTGEVVKLAVESVTVRSADFFLQLHGLSERTKAERYKSWYIDVPSSILEPREEGDYLPWQLEGLRVVKSDGAVVGKVKELVFTPANPILEIDNGESCFYVVFSMEQVPVVDLEAGLIIVADHVGEGFQ